MISIKRSNVGDDPMYRIYHSRYELSATVEAGIRGIPVEAPVLEAALAIAGVAKAMVHAYELHVVCSPMYEWEEIEPALLKLLASFNLPSVCAADGSAYTI